MTCAFGVREPWTSNRVSWQNCSMTSYQTLHTFTNFDADDAGRPRDLCYCVQLIRFCPTFSFLTNLKAMNMWQDSVVSSRGMCTRISAMSAVMLLCIIAAFVIIKQMETDTTSPQDLSIKQVSSTMHQNHGSKLIQVHADGGAKYNVTEQAVLQIQHCKQDIGLIINIHMTHPGGTTVCRTIGHSPNGTAPSRACNRPTENDGDDIEFPERIPWLHTQTAENAKLIRKHFHMIGMEFGCPKTITCSDALGASRLALHSRHETPHESIAGSRRMAS